MLRARNNQCSYLFVQVARLESQVVRYKSAAETSEKLEDELKLEKRKLQREVRFVENYRFVKQLINCKDLKNIIPVYNYSVITRSERVLEFQVFFVIQTPRGFEKMLK